MIEWKDGDIYERQIDNGPPIYKVIVKKHRRSAVVLRIYDVPQIENNHAVTARREGYVGAGYLYAESPNALNEAQLVRSMTAEEYDSLLIAVAGALGLEMDPAASEGSASSLRQLVAQEDLSGTEQIVAAAGEINTWPPLESVKDFARIEAERDVYREMVFKLLDRR